MVPPPSGTLKKNLRGLARERLLTAKALFDGNASTYTYNLARLRLTRGTGFQTHSQVCRAEGLIQDTRFKIQDFIF